MTAQPKGVDAANVDALPEITAAQTAFSSSTSVPRPRDHGEGRSEITGGRGLVVPEVTDDTSTLTAALAYADAGFYVLPINGATRIPLLKEWQRRSSRDRDQLCEWFIGTDHALALHAGRSGVVVFDVDRPERIPEALSAAIEDYQPPFHATRDEHNGRGHYLFEVPVGRLLGNGRGKLFDKGTDPKDRSRSWGEVRGHNGFIIVSPSEHAKSGHYHWERGGAVPLLPEAISALLPEGSETGERADDDAVTHFMAKHTRATRPWALRWIVDRFHGDAASGSRHEAMIEALCFAMRDARRGYYPAAQAREVLQAAFMAVMAADPATAGRPLLFEFHSGVAFAVGQAQAEELSELIERAEGPASEPPAEEDPPLPLEERSLPHEPEHRAEGAGALETAALTTPAPRSPGPVETGSYELMVQEQMRYQAARDEAARRLQARSAGAMTIPRPIRGDIFLSVPDEPVQYRIEGLQPVGARAVFAAQFKAGKSTGMGNLTRCLADGTPFLDVFDVIRPEGGVVVIDNELDERMLRRWTREQGIENVDRVHIVSLRGRVSTFDILNESVRAQWAAAIRATGATYVIFDCLRPVLDALGLSEDKDAGRFLVAFDALLAEAGIAEAVVVHHAGHSGDRSRGDSRIRDWPDVEWRLVRQKGTDGSSDPAAPRFFSAFGRDVDVPEGLLTFEPTRRRLTYTTTSREAAAGEAALPAVLDLLAKHPNGLSGRAVEDEAPSLGASRDAIRKALIAGRKDGSITCVPGPRRAVLHVRTIPTASRAVA